MEKIKHSTVFANGINIHVASVGPNDGPPVLFLHGYPGLWYTWRHQMLSLSSLGYRCIAPDLRGYGDTDAPESADEYTMLHVVGDLIGMMDAVGVEKFFLVSHDWGAFIAWHLCLFRPDRVAALVANVAYLLRDPTTKMVEGFRKTLGDDVYICKFQVPGEAEADFARADIRKLIKFFLARRDPNPPRFPKEIELSCLAELPLEQPPWLTEDDITYYASKFGKKGFTRGLNYYRALDRTWELTAPWTGAKVEVPVKFVVGDLDMAYHFPGIKQYVHEGGMKKMVPKLEEVVVMEETGQFLQEEKPHEVTAHIYDFIKKF